MTQEQHLEMVNPKASFDEYYTLYSPKLYASLLLKGLNYRLPFDAMTLLRDYLDRRVIPNSLEVVFLGSGHGLESAVLKYGYSYEDILQCWLDSEPHEHLFSGGNPRFKITMVDINEAPLHFAYDVGLCDRFFPCNLREKWQEEIDWLLNNQTDLLVCVGSTTYIGLDSFKRLVRIVEESKIQYFCFSLLGFISNSYLKIFNQSNLQLHKLGNVKQRDYKDDREKSSILENLSIQNRYSIEDEHGLMASIFIAHKH